MWDVKFNQHNRLTGKVKLIAFMVKLYDISWKLIIFSENDILKRSMGQNFLELFLKFKQFRNNIPAHSSNKQNS